MIRILLVDDQALIRRGLRSLLKPEPDLIVMGEAENGAMAIETLQTLAPEDLPNVILMDIRMPIMDGVAATATICDRYPTISILVLTTFDDTEYVTRALQSGASGYLLKDTPAEELVQAIQLVSKGYTQLSPGLAQKLVQQSLVQQSLVQTGQSSQSQPLETSPVAASKEVSAELLSELTPREQEILQLIAQGSSNREIAQSLYISEKTVKNHITNLLSRLGLRDRTQAAIYFHGKS
jgi:DNA-binding NarL/FixJ family response regulator